MKHKISQEYLSAVTPEPKYSRNEHADFVADSQSRALNKYTWNSQQSASRKRNLREGLVELQHRKHHIDRSLAERRERKMAESLQLATAPEREDERLTNPTVHTALLPSRGGPLQDLNREKRLKRMRANVETMQRRKAEQRRAWLHTLYMNARDFIVRPAQLDEAVDRAFDDPNQFLSDETQGENVWHLGAPETVQDLLRVSQRNSGKKNTTRAQWVKDLTEKRLDTIGEELTGGKL